jgi:sRNA-binding protein
VQLLHDARDLQGAVGVRHPMQVDADRLGPLACEEAGHVEAAAIHHAQRQIDDPHAHAAIVQIARDRQNPEGYISNTVEEGTMSLTGPYRIARFRKS